VSRAPSRRCEPPPHTQNAPARLAGASGFTVSACSRYLGLIVLGPILVVLTVLWVVAIV
jgi:hypothetical protein